MEKKSLFIMIKSKYTIKNILSFIEDYQFVFKLVLYSKLSQKKMDISLLDCLYIKNRFNLESYLCYEITDFQNFDIYSQKKD